MEKNPRSQMSYSDAENYVDALTRARQAHFARVAELLFARLVAAGWTAPDGYTTDDLRKEYTRTNYDAWQENRDRRLD